MTASSLGSVINSEKLLESARSLPPLPVSAIRLAGLVSDPDVDVLDIVETISLDQSLTAAVLRQANSAASANRVRIGTVRDAVVRLGMNMVLSIALSGHMSKQMIKAVPEYGLGAGELWKHSVISSICADLIRGRSSVRVPTEAATAALVHDIGKLVLCRYMSPHVLELIAQAGELEGDSDFEAEQKVLEVHHGDVGALVAEHWRLPESIVVAVKYHHTPSERPEPICYAVALGDMITDYLMGPGLEILRNPGQQAPILENLAYEGRVLDRLTEALVELRIDPDVCRELVYATASRYQDVRARYLVPDDEGDDA
jgi:HD-like signal output (HDOD) protein